MVLQKRLDYGFNGYQVPTMPRATRSARKRGSFWKKVQDNQPCAFDLLATVAGKLLLEGESFSPAANTPAGKDQSEIFKDAVKKEQRDEESPLKVESFDQGNCDKGFFFPELGSQVHNPSNTLKEFTYVRNDAFSGVASAITTCDCPQRVGSAEKLVLGKSKSDIGNFARKVGVGLSRDGESSHHNLENEQPNRDIKAEPLKTAKVKVGSETGQCAAEDPVVCNGKPSVLVSSDCSAKAPLCRDRIPCGSFSPCREDVKLVSRDDDENSSGCTQPSTTTKTFRPPSRIGDRRIRKLLASKYWRVSPKNEELSNIDGELKPIYRNRKTCNKRPRSQRNYPFKKRKLFDCSSASNSDGGISSDSIPNLLDKGINGDASGSCADKHGVAGQRASGQSRDSQVKLRIKSFRVPELFIDIPETATVGSLKRAVMEAVAAILGGGLCVGVHIQGKKVRDDNKTLLQAGISHDKKLDALGFTLEPNPSQASTSLCQEAHPFLIPCDAPQPLTRYPPTSTQGASDVSPDPPVTNLGNCIESDHDSAPSPTDMSMEKSAADSRALIAVPAVSMEALTVVPAHRKSKRSEVAQRRIRRPFSVSEVEALVQAVEKLGTGRWRDVKLRAFDNAKHRTYVDLKDKWKTLVHTARISPQQRRGEPVPQELLDRVLTAHAYWSQQQSKQQLKQPPPETCLLL
ncbi:telomere repeat-binding protein 5-like isoform X2 [Malania oleifera]|uniref:telomere repeat-binding protein 5-like isoform X2 n=1 Tax=Malania oleifera TaxID=397392 RepID=UPI0025AE98CD|nr:telomere repeat-binding protein 5-like isoform X2 [Malania oleifera]